LKKKYIKAKFLLITPDKAEIVLNKVKMLGLNEEDFKIVFSPRNEVRKWVSSTDISISFIKQSYSKIASSPTKLGELLAMGIPVVCNSQVGDVKDIIEKTQGGILIDEFKKDEYEKAISKIDELMKIDRKEIRNRAFQYYNLEDAIQEYSSCYSRLLRNT
ncbi:MAG: glycosyltransferase, partial [Cytophagaceae bacterium]|nr:glycosyltransferase [Cytophagaceae bacterium]